MADSKDMEKEPIPGSSMENTHQSSVTDLSSKNSKEEEEEKKTSVAHSTYSSSSASTHSDTSDNSDPLSPLERALTPNLYTEDEQTAYQSITHTKTGASVATTGSRNPSFEVDFTDNDPDDPKNWPLWYRGVTIASVSYATWTVVLYSTSYTASMPGMMKEFHVTSQPIATLGITTYLVGLAVGSLILAPLSEQWGRRPVYLASLAFFCLMVLPCALAKNLPMILVIRFLGYVLKLPNALFSLLTIFSACAGAAMISNSPGSVADIVTENYRALAFSIWSIGPMNGPVTGPLIGGFAAQYLGWRWTNWLVMIFSGVALLFMMCIKETYAPSILRKKAAKMRKEMDDERYWSRYDEKRAVIPMLKVNLSRPFVLTATEPILWFWDLYIGVSYATFGDHLVILPADMY